MKIQNDNSIISDALGEFKKGNIRKCEEKLTSTLVLSTNVDQALNIIGICRYYYCDFTTAKKAWSISYSQYKNINAKKYLAYLECEEGKEIIDLYQNAIQDIKNEDYLMAKKKLNNLLELDSNLVAPKRITSIIDYQHSKIKDISSEIEDPSNIDMVLNNYKYNNRILKGYKGILIFVLLILSFILGCWIGYN